MVDEQPGHFLFMFSEPGKLGRHIAFASFGEDVRRVYFTPGHATDVDDGHCEMSWVKKKIANVLCAAVVTEAGWKRVVVVNFKPDQNS